MGAPKKRDIEHKYAARIDNTPDPESGKDGLWTRIVAYSERRGISINDALNDLLHSGAARRKLP